MGLFQKQVEDRLEEHGIQPTSIRLLVIKCLMESETPLSLIEIEEKLDSVERSSVSRALTLFKKKHLVHCFEDGSGSLKYELCQVHHHSVNDLHVHFRCIICGKTFCINDVAIPEVNLPVGYEIYDINYVLSGRCPDCTT